MLEGADKNLKNEEGKNALHFAAERGDEKMVRSLVEKGLLINDKDKDGNTALHLAAKGEHRGVALFLSRRSNVDALNNNDETPFHVALKNDQNATASTLWATGANILSTDKMGVTTLHSAAGSGHIDMVKNLKPLNVSPHEKDAAGKTALHHAAEKGRTEVITNLLNQGANIEEQDNSGKTALHYAAANGYINVVQELLANGADVNAKNMDGYTPLNVAAARGHKDTMQRLIHYGAQK